MKLYKQNNTVLNAQGKFSQTRDDSSVPASLRPPGLERLNLTQLGELVIKRFNSKNLEVSEVRPFFWSLVETYLDRFGQYPFDASKALISYLEMKDYPEEMIIQLVEQLESQFEKSHGRPLRKSQKPKPLPEQVALDDEMNELRDILKYAAMVGENSEKE